MTTNIFDGLEADDGALARLHQRLEHDAHASDVEGHDAVLAGLADRISPRVLRAPTRLDSAARQIDEYSAKRRTVFEVPVDLRLADGFRRDVIDHLRDIAYGHRES